MKYFTEETIATLQEEYKQFKSVQFVGLQEHPTTFKTELLLLQSYNILELASSNIELIQWDVVSPVEGTTEIKVLHVGDIIALRTTDDSLTDITRATASNYVFIPSLHTFGMYTKDTGKLTVNNSTVIKELYSASLLPELQYIKQKVVAKVLPNLLAERTANLKTATTNRKARGFTKLPVKGDKFKIRTYASMKKEFGEEVSSVQVENEEGELESLDLPYIPATSSSYGVPFIKLCESICGTEGTITSYDSKTGIIKATYTINGKEVSSITTVMDGTEELELAEPLTLHEQHIIKI